MEKASKVRDTEREKPIRVLVASSVGGYLAGTTLDSALAAALELRGAEVHVLLCDKDLPACMECSVKTLGGAERLLTHGPSRALCGGCFRSGRKAFDDLRVTVHSLGAYLTAEDRERAVHAAASVPIDGIKDFCIDGLPLGEHAMAGALRFFARATIDQENGADGVAQKYLEAAILTATASRRLLATVGFDRVVLHHGIYIPQGTIASVARSAGVPVVTWNPAYRSQCFVFSHDDTYHHTLMSEPTSLWENIEWTDDLEALTGQYLESRWTGTKDWISFQRSPEDDLESIQAEIGVDFGRPTIGLLTNVMWDAQLHYPANLFENMREWCLATIKYFAARPELQLLIRVHPAELRGWMPSRQPILGEIETEFPALPPNVFVISPESSVSTYAAMYACDSVLIYGTKTGVELAAMGIPVIVAGEAWIRGKAVSIDPGSRDEYFRVLDRLPIGARLDPAVRSRAMKYAFHFFFRRMIPLEFTEPAGQHTPYKLAVTSFDQLRNGNSIGLDIICEGILTGTPFVYPAERYTLISTETDGAHSQTGIRARRATTNSISQRT